MGLFTGKTVIVTGGGKATLKDGSAGSIGYGIDIAFAKEGANLVITGRNVAKLEAAKAFGATTALHPVSLAIHLRFAIEHETAVAQVLRQFVDRAHGLRRRCLRHPAAREPPRWRWPD